MKIILMVCMSIVIVASPAFTQNVTETEIIGNKLNLEITTGLQGAFSFAQLGINLPQFINHFVIGIKLRGMSSLTWATFIDEQTKNSVSFHPIIISGILSVGGTGNIVKNIFRSYGALEILVGHSFTPYDSIIYNVENLIGNNVTLGIFGIYGLEYFTSPKVSVYIESGGGFKTVKAESSNQYVVASSWLGSGVTLRMGTKLYL